MSNNTKTDLDGKTWVLMEPEYPEEGWIMEGTKEFPKVYQDGGEWETDGDEDGSWENFVPDFSVTEKCPFCGSDLDFEIFDKDGENALISVYCSNHGEKLLWFPSHEVFYTSDGYDEGETLVPYGDTYVKLPY